MNRSGSILRRVGALRVRRSSPERGRRATKASLAVENLEGRLVLSHVAVQPSDFSHFAPVLIFSHGNDGGGWPGLTARPTSLLGQDAAAVQQAYRTFDSAYLAAVSALRPTATTTSPPTSAGITAFDTAIASAITTLNSTITTDLSNLPNTGAGLANTITTYNTNTLQSEIDGAATGLANSTNWAVWAMNREVNGYLRAAQSQASSTILSDSPTGMITWTTLKTYNQAVWTAEQTFAAAIASAAQTAISTSSQLDSTVVGTASPSAGAIGALDTALTTAIGNLGLPPATVSTLSATVTTDLNNLATSLDAIAAPTAGNPASAFLFPRTIRITVGQTECAINQAVASAVQTYNDSLL